MDLLTRIIFFFSRVKHRITFEIKTFIEKVRNAVQEEWKKFVEDKYGN